jgi:hypothetical protein
VAPLPAERHKMPPRRDSVTPARKPRTRRAAPGRGRPSAIPAVALLLGALWLSQQLGHGAVAAPQGGPVAIAPGAGPAVVYQRYARDPAPREILWRPLSSSEEKVARVSFSEGKLRHLSSAETSVRILTEAEGGLGYLPSPDGRHLLVWEAKADPTHPPEPITHWFITHWFVQPLPTGPPMEIGETAGLPLLLPFWQDSRHVELAGEVTLGGDRELAVFNLRSRKLSRPLPVVQQNRVYERDYGVDHWLARTRLEAYAHRHLLPELTLLRSALRTGRAGGGLGLPSPGIYEDLHGLFAEPPEYLLLRAIGLPTLGELSRYPPYHRPQFACAPDGNAIAYYWVYQHTEGSDLAKHYGVDASGRPLKKGIYARIDVHYLSPPRDRVVAVIAWPSWTPHWPHHLIPVSTDVRIGVPPMCRDLRWSRDGRYLSFTEALAPRSDATVKVFDTVTWTEVLSIPHAESAFVIPGAVQAGATDAEPGDARPSE